MNWYYAHQGQQVGPVEEVEFRALIRSGVIQPDTLVWHNGLAAWQPLAPSGMVGIPASGLTPAGESLEGSAQTMCSQCGQGFPPDEIIQVGGFPVCAACKPILVQKLQEGVANPAVYGVAVPRYAGFWIRFAAFIIDYLIKLPASYLLNYLFLSIFHFAPGGLTINQQNGASLAGFLFAMLGYWIVILGITSSYEAICMSRFGGLPGMLICGLRVVRPNGQRLTFWRGIGRYLAAILSGITIGIGYLLIAFDEQKRALHDMICDCRVVYK